jgi:hypothetical protein
LLPGSILRLRLQRAAVAAQFPPVLPQFASILPEFAPVATPLAAVPCQFPAVPPELDLIATQFAPGFAEFPEIVAEFHAVPPHLAPLRDGRVGGFFSRGGGCGEAAKPAGNGKDQGGGEEFHTTLSCVL